jgi:hypothetical protein
LGLELVDTGKSLRLWNPVTQEFLLTHEESEEEREMERVVRLQETEARIEEMKARKKAEEAKLRVENELARALEEIARLKAEKRKRE